MSRTYVGLGLGALVLLLAILFLSAALLKGCADAVGTLGSSALPTVIPTTSANSTRTPREKRDSTRFYNLPATTLLTESGLYTSPNSSEPMTVYSISAGQTLFVLNTNSTNSWLRVAWDAVMGWVPIAWTDYGGQRDRLARLPVIRWEQPPCAVPIMTQFSMESISGRSHCNSCGPASPQVW